MTTTELLIYAAGLAGLLGYNVWIRRKLGQIAAGRAEGDTDRMQRSLKLAWALMGLLVAAWVARLVFC